MHPPEEFLKHAAECSARPGEQGCVEPDGGEMASM
jgi:hypothetical protein